MSNRSAPNRTHMCPVFYIPNLSVLHGWRDFLLLVVIGFVTQGQPLSHQIFAPFGVNTDSSWVIGRHRIVPEDPAHMVEQLVAPSITDGSRNWSKRSRKNWAYWLPWDAERVNHALACSRSCSTSRPRRYSFPKVYCANGSCPAAAVQYSQSLCYILCHRLTVR